MQAELQVLPDGELVDLEFFPLSTKLLDHSHLREQRGRPALFLTGNLEHVHDTDLGGI